MSAAVSVANAVKSFETTRALDGVSLDIHANEFFTLLGPSGCGKTTLLRAIAGFEGLDQGRVLLFGDDITGLAPDKRPVNTVFQHYALFPHMSVAENVAFGLRRLGAPESRVRETVAEMLDLVKLGDFATRKPTQLSGGQAQRVALARALAPEPKVLLLDEPLSALDLKLRQAMRLELKALQKKTGVTFVFVTHDQEEALAMSDRIAVMSAGKVQQIGMPQEIYEHPTNRFVADFIGDANFLQAEVSRIDGGFALCHPPGGPTLVAANSANARQGEAVTLFLRPEKISVHDEAIEDGIPAIVRTVVYLGDATDYVLDFEGGLSLTSRCENRINGESILEPGEKAHVRIAPGAARTLAA